MKNNQKGFSTIELVIVVVVVALLGGAGWFVYNRQNNTANNTTSTPTTSGRENEEEVQPSDTKEIVDKNGLVNCNDQFELTIPKDWHAYHLDIGAKNCTVSNVAKKDLAPVGNMSGKNISFVFTVESNVTKSLKDWVNDFVDTNLVNGEYPSKVLSKETATINNFEEAIIIDTSGGHYNDKSTYFFYKKDKLIIYTSWSTNSELHQEALTAINTIN